MATVFSVSALQSELFLDPVRIGYAPWISAGDHNGVYDLVNRPTSGGAFQVNRDPVVPEIMFGEMDPADFEAMTTTQLARLQVLMVLPSINLADTSTKAIVDGLFANGSVTRQQLSLLQKREGSRAEVLWGEGCIVTLNQIAQALA